MIAPFFRIRILILFLGIIFHFQAIGQENDRPRIGLVLSGGGAKGLAHIGVLKAMEEAGIYPDYITGTSMGSIVGGLYAIGYSADQVDSIARAIDWSRMLSNNIPFDKVAFEEKSYYGRYIIEFPFHNGKLGLPKGLIEGQELTLQMSNMTRPVHHIYDFNEFPVPFACIGADIITGYTKVFNSGVLPETLRASMAIPTFFTPVEIDSNLYVDGGVIRNFPVQEVIDMGADIIIGVTVSTGLDPREKINSMTSILGQAAFIASAHDTEQQEKMVDILISPELNGYSTGSFGNSNEILALGDSAGQKYLPVFKRLADSLSSYGPMTPPARPEIPATYQFKNIEILGNTRVPDELIMGKLRIASDKSFTIEELEERINLLYGTLYFEKIVYTINPVSSTLTIKVIEGPRGSIRTAVHYDTDNQAGININLTLRNYLFPSSRFIFEFDLAQNPSASLSYFKYLGKKQNLAVVLSGSWLNTELPSYWDESGEGSPSGNEINGLLDNRVINPAIRIQTTNKTNATFGVGFEYTRHKIKPLVHDSISISGINLAFHDLNTNDLGGELFYKLNTLNKPFFATKGIRVDVTLEYLFSRQFKTEFRSNTLGTIVEELELSDHYFASVSVMGVAPILNRLSFLYGLNIRMGNGTGGIEWFPYETFIGGTRPIGWSVQQYEATPAKRFSNLNYASLMAGLQWEPFSNVFITGKIDYLESEYPMKWLGPDIHTESFGAYDRRLGFSAKLAYNSIVGPLELGIGKDQYISGAHVFFGFGYYIKR